MNTILRKAFFSTLFDQKALLAACCLMLASQGFSQTKPKTTSPGTKPAASKTSTSTPAPKTGTATAKPSSTTPASTIPSVSPAGTGAGSATTSAPSSTPAATPTNTTPAKPTAVSSDTFTPKKQDPFEKPVSKPVATKEPEEEEPAPTPWINPEHTSESYMNIKEGWFVGADFGSNLFYGDVALYNVFPKPSDFRQSFGNGYGLYFGKKFKFGLSAEIQGCKGTLRGEKITDNLYPRYFRADVIDYSLSVKYNLSQLIFREIPGRKFFNRFTVYITAGGGQMLYRSRLYKYARNDQWYLEKATGYTTTGIDSAGPGSGGGLVATKTKFQSAIIIPAGGKINFKLNGQTDLVLDFRYVTVLSDKIDSWERSWSHQDKYLYTGIGFVYNVGMKSAGDIPEDQRLLRPRKHKKTSGSDEYSGSTAAPSTIERSSRRSSKGKKEDKDLEIKLKLYELQLKMFEMQYMLSN